jgi:transcriptional antiterminator RfaH
LIPALHQKVDAINASGGETLHEIQPGDKVRLVGGPFAGYEAIFNERLPGTERVRVLLKLLQKRVLSVELPAGQVKKTGRS